ncbi:dephospho-CoA kinase [Rhodoferax sp.]|uniref:dephospho-CoA kinase n=1 Tax=Rhodoferax sp. TaxID=50421 RepID=UPI00261447B3|nr:dephospho-CoA kinase [Rhodoferax sp.]MDD2926513.1 dephospho-CoA kinase [Rhodoferax sp.]
MARAWRLGLTGGIGSGKSTVAAVLAELGAAVIDADALARSVTAPGGLAIAAIRQVFGDDFITEAGALDRDRMRTLAYADTSARQRLEAIIHPLVSQATWRQASVAEASGHACLVFDVPLLVESAHWRRKVDQVLVVDCDAETQISRVMTRSALERSAVQAIIAAQASRERRLKAADAVIYNDGISLAVLREHVHALAASFGLSLTHHPDPAQLA